MKAKCIKELTFDGYKFEVGKEYDFYCNVIYLPGERSNVVLGRGNRTRHLKYSTVIEVKFASSIHGVEKVPMEIFLYDRQYCIANDWKTAQVGVPGTCEELLCFDDWFKEEFDRSGRVWHPNDWSDLRPKEMAPWVKEELAKTAKAVLGDRAEEPVIMPTNMPTRMDMERWRHEMMGYPRRPKEIRVPENTLKDLCDYLIREGCMESFDIEEMKELGIVIKSE